MPEFRCAKCHQSLIVNDSGEVAPCAHCAVVNASTTTKPQRSTMSRRPRKDGSSLLLTGPLAAIASLGFYFGGPLTTLRETAFYNIFCGHGWVPYITVFLFFVALCTLMLRTLFIQREQSAFALQLLPEEEGSAIDSLMAAKILDRIERLSQRQKGLMLVTRIRGSLLRFNQLQNSEHLDHLLKNQSDSDAMAVETAYALPRFIIWAIPVLGFVGTVIGISNGVSAFSTLIQNAADLEGLRESLKGVTYGLGQAFETTMVALCMSLILMLIMSFLQRREDALLTLMHEYCLENLVQRVRSERSRTGANLDHLVEVLHRLVDRLSSIGHITSGGSVPHTAIPHSVL